MKQPGSPESCMKVRFCTDSGDFSGPFEQNLGNNKLEEDFTTHWNTELRCRHMDLHDTLPAERLQDKTDDDFLVIAKAKFWVVHVSRLHNFGDTLYALDAPGLCGLQTPRRYRRWWFERKPRQHSLRH